MTEKYIIINGKNVLTRNDNTELSKEEFYNIKQTINITDEFSEDTFAIHVLNTDYNQNPPQNYQWTSIRSIFALHNNDYVQLSRAKAISEWRNSANFCEKCGSPLSDCENITARQCNNCGNTVFPRINPCIIVLVSKGDQILLARHAQRNQDIFACLAGFVEAGETVENAVKREILEETGIKVKNVKYFGSQSWPFPAQLMLGFHAEYESGEIKLQPEEIAEANWFTKDNCPTTPLPGSLAYMLIKSKFGV